MTLTRPCRKSSFLWQLFLLSIRAPSVSPSSQGNKLCPLNFVDSSPTQQCFASHNTPISSSLEAPTIEAPQPYFLSVDYFQLSKESSRIRAHIASQFHRSLLSANWDISQKLPGPIVSDIKTALALLDLQWF